MRKVGVVVLRRKSDQLTAVDAEQSGDPSQRIVNRVIDCFDRQVNEARRQLRQHAFEVADRFRFGRYPGNIRLAHRDNRKRLSSVSGNYVHDPVRLLLTLCLRSLIGIVTAWLPATNAQPSDPPPLQILVGVPPGGTSDLIARVIAERLKDDLARPVIVENKPGATGRIAVNALRNAKPDGSTLLLVPITVPVIVPLVFNDVNYDASKDLVPVSQIATYEFALVVAADHPSRNVREFVAWAKSNH